MANANPDESLIGDLILLATKGSVLELQDYLNVYNLEPNEIIIPVSVAIIMETNCNSYHVL